MRQFLRVKSIRARDPSTVNRTGLGREVGKSDMKLERMKLKSSVSCWKVRAEVVKDN